MPRVIGAVLLLVLACGLPPRPEFRPTTIDNDEAIRVWLEDGQPIILTHSYEDDQVDVSIALTRADPTHLACLISVENRSQHDAIIDFTNTTIEDTEQVVWTLDGTAFSVEGNDWSGEWRVSPGEGGTFNALYVSTAHTSKTPVGFTVRLLGFIGPFELTDEFSFARISWP